MLHAARCGFVCCTGQHGAAPRAVVFEVAPTAICSCMPSPMPVKIRFRAALGPRLPGARSMRSETSTASPAQSSTTFRISACTIRSVGPDPSRISCPAYFFISFPASATGAEPVREHRLGWNVREVLAAPLRVAQTRGPSAGFLFFTGACRRQMPRATMDPRGAPERSRRNSLGAFGSAEAVGVRCRFGSEIFVKKRSMLDRGPELGLYLPAGAPQCAGT